MNERELLQWIQAQDKDRLQELYQKAFECKKQTVLNVVYLRGLIELSNVCTKNCFYCGIRGSNKNVHRYTLSLEEVFRSVKYAYDKGFRSIVLQAGERQDDQFTDYIEEIIKKIKEISKGELRITLSLGEQKREVLQRWRAAGAERYLLRIETSSADLYARIHPSDHSFKDRLASLLLTRELGYQVGTGFLIGVPGQVDQDLVDDLLFLKEHDIDMVGMGPFLLHPDAPISKNIEYSQERNLQLGLKMIALARLFLKDINIAATTALHALNSCGRELGLDAGANVIMPNITPQQYRSYYSLYDHKPNFEENNLCLLQAHIEVQGGRIAYHQHGDALHYCRRVVA